MGYYVAIKVSPEGMKHFKVPQEASIYIKQLENALRFRKTKEALEKLYPGRFTPKEESDGKTSQSNRPSTK